MKNAFVALALFFSLQVSAQIPDELGVSLPWEYMRIYNCTNSMGEPPKSDNVGVTIQLDSDVLEENSNGDCIKRTRTWEINDLIGGETYSFVQTGAWSIGGQTFCQSDLIITEDDLPFTLNKDNVVLNQVEGYEYSFSYDDKNDIERVIQTSYSTIKEFYLYNHTSQNVCKVNVFISPCEEEIVFDIPEIAEIEFNKEPYLLLTPEMLGVEIVYPCASFTTDIRVGFYNNNNLLKPLYIGKVVPVQVHITFDDGTKYIRVIEVTVSGDKPDPIQMFIEDKSFVAGETIELEVWSENLEGLQAWQIQIQFDNTEVLEVAPSNVFTEVPFSILDGGSRTRTLWFPLDTQPVDVEVVDTWFTLTVTPNFDGSTVDIFQSEQDPWSAISIDDINYVYDYEAEFLFHISPRIISDVEDAEKSDLRVFPNPASNKVTISGLSNSDLTSNINLYNMEGKLLLSKNVQNNQREVTIDISDLPAGLFILKAKNGDLLTSKKLFKI